MKVLRTVLHLLESICSNNQMPQQQQNREWGGGGESFLHHFIPRLPQSYQFGKSGLAWIPNVCGIKSAELANFDQLRRS